MFSPPKPSMKESLRAGGRSPEMKERFRGLDNFGVVLSFVPCYVIQERYPIKMSQLAFHIRIDAKQHNEENLK